MILTILIGFFLIVVASGLAYDVGVRVERWKVSRAKAITADSMFCSCGNEWGKWQNIETQRRPVDPKYPLTGGYIENHVQTRHCTSCNRADRRVL